VRFSHRKQQSKGAVCLHRVPEAAEGDGLSENIVLSSGKALF
jgi:hypothetical protein